MIDDRSAVTNNGAVSELHGRDPLAPARLGQYLVPVMCRAVCGFAVFNSAIYRLSMIVCSFPNRNVERSISMKLCSSAMKAALALRASSVFGALPMSTQASA
jgi:hypothetical protein